MPVGEAKRILLVEDSPYDAELVAAALDEHGLADELAVARDGQEALDYLFRRGDYVGRSGGDPAVVLLDMRLPGVDGLEVLGKLKGDEALRSIPVVMLTSSREGRDVVRSYELGANAYVVKPIDFQEYAEVVGRSGQFWVSVNQPPPPKTERRALIRTRNA